MTINEAIDQIDWSRLDIAEFAAEWVSTYREWRAEGLHHEIEAAPWDCTDGLVAIKADPDEMGWDEFLGDYTGEWQPTYESGAGKLWVTWEKEYNDEWYSLCQHFIVQEVAAMMGIVDEQAVADLSYNDEVSVEAWECDKKDLAELEAVIAAQCIMLDD